MSRATTLNFDMSRRLCWTPKPHCYNPLVERSETAPRAGLVTAVTGIRDLSSGSEPDVWNAMADEVHGGTSVIRFGGAIGVDTIALLAADMFRGSRTKLTVVVPSALDDQPEDAVEAALAAADEVVELGLERGTARSNLRRNDELLRGADRLIAFTDGRDQGGTSYTIDRALARGLDVVIVPVRGTGAKRANPWIDFDEFLAPVHALEEYVPRNPGSDLTDFVWALKGYEAKPSALLVWGERLAATIRVPSASVHEPRGPNPYLGHPGGRRWAKGRFGSRTLSGRSRTGVGVGARGLGGRRSRRSCGSTRSRWPAPTV